jgi:hypothetical protein
MKVLLKNIQKKQIVILSVVCAVFLVSSVLYLAQRHGSRRIFFFPASDGRVYTEIRFLARKQGDEAVRQYAAELLLGSVNAHFKSLFSPGTTVLSCFVRDKVLYFDISETALFPSESACAIRDGVALFERNISRNFGAINAVELYIDGTRAYEKSE